MTNTADSLMTYIRAHGVTAERVSPAAVRVSRTYRCGGFRSVETQTLPLRLEPIREWLGLAEWTAGIKR